MKFATLYAVLFGLFTCGVGMNAALAHYQVEKDNSVPAPSAIALATKNTNEEFIVRGNEPFWSVTVSRRGIVYSTPEIRGRRYPYVAPTTAQGRPPDVVRVYRLNGQPSGILVIKKADACSDTMSDKVYPYSATLILGNRVLDGCAEKK
jgi:uncharacterized membrane protein